MFMGPAGCWSNQRRGGGVGVFVVVLFYRAGERGGDFGGDGELGLVGVVVAHDLGPAGSS